MVETMTLNIKRQHPHFFAEVSGINLATSLANGTLAEILDAFAANSVLLFRKQVLDDGSQIAFSEKIGPLEKNISHTFGNSRPEISKISN